MSVAAVDAPTSCPVEVPLPSGRSVTVRAGGGREVLEVRAAGGAVEVEVVLTDEGPVVRLSGARLEIASPAAVRVDCRRLELRAAEGLSLESDADVRLRAGGDVHLNGK